MDTQSLLHIQTERVIFLIVAFSEVFSGSDFATKGPLFSSVLLTDCVLVIDFLKNAFFFLRSRNNSYGELERVIRLP